MHGNWNGKVIVITGASSGFGKGVAWRFAKAGASVVLAARRGMLLDDLRKECEALGGQALAVETDVGNEADMTALMVHALDAFGRVDAWINNAGVGSIGRFEEIPLADQVKVIQTDLVGTMFGCHLALRQFRSQGHGILINVASALGKLPAPYFAAYTAAKHGVVGLSAAIRQELRENKLDNIHVCTVMPMAMDTPFFEHAGNYTGRKAVPVPPLYDPRQVIDAIFRLASEPEDEIIVGSAGKVMDFAHDLVSTLTEHVLGRTTHHEQMEKAPPAPVTPGAVHRPVPQGTDVSGGLRTKK